MLYKIKSQNAVKILLTIMLIIFFFNIELSAQDFVCGTTGTSTSSGQTGGLYLPSHGTLKVLIVFVRFKDDADSHNYWPSDGFPTFTNTYIDPNAQTGSTHYLNLTNYYRTMSLDNELIVIGEVKNIVTNENRAYYFNSANYGSTNPRYFATKKILQDQVDTLVNFNDYDNWSYDSNSNPPHINQPDGTVDMIIMIWRGLQFATWGGKADLGGHSSYPSYTVENGTKTIKARFGANSGSGVTVHSNGGKWPEYNFHSAVHEVAHWLLGLGHPYGGDSPNNHEFWGMLTPSSFGICANAYEREKLNWIKSSYPVVNITGDMYNPTKSIEDYVTTGRIYKYHPSNGETNEYYYFENHQQLNIYDDVTKNSNDKGIFVLHQGGDYLSGDVIRVKTSNGQWNWQNTGNASCFGGATVPKLKPVSVNRSGKNNRDKFGYGSNAWLFYLTASGIAGWSSGGCGGWLHGDGLNNSFNLTYNNVLSPYSNPYSNTWDDDQTSFTMEISNQSGSTLYAKFYLTDPDAGKPAKPQNLRLTKDGNNHPVLNWDANTDPDLSSYRVYKKLTLSGGSNQTSYITTTSTTYTDADFIANPHLGSDQAEYWIVAVDNTSQLSIESDHASTSGQSSIQWKLGGNEDISYLIKNYELYQNYPNPFNPATTIQYDVKEKGFVQLKVYDILGKEVAELVNEVQEKGIYASEFNASKLPSGIYIYFLRVNDFVSYRKMILLK